MSEYDEQQWRRREQMNEYEARRCHICQCKWPRFGFSPPLTPPGVELWACGAHRQEVEAMFVWPR